MIIDHNSLLKGWLKKLNEKSQIRQNVKVTIASCCMQNLRGEKVEWVRLAGQGWADYVCQTRRIGDLAERLVGNDWRILRKQDPDYFSPSLNLSRPTCDLPWWAAGLHESLQPCSRAASRLGICQKIYTTQFLGERILHTENA